MPPSSFSETNKMKLFTNSTIRRSNRSNPQKAFKHTVPPPSPRWAFLRSALGIFVFAFTFGSAWNVAFGQSLATNFYTVSSEDFANPERGFYIQADSYASAPSSVTANLASYRINGKSSPGNTYTAKISLLLRVFYLDTFTNAPISSNFLNSIQTDFNSIRAQGCKSVVRFAYNQDQTSPFAEPTKARILAHIEQLKPLLKTNSDVIAVLQQGFIGAWGETSSVAILDNDVSILRARYNGMAASGFLRLKITLE